EGEEVVVQLRERPHVVLPVHDHLLPVQRRVEVRDDAYAPGALIGEYERVGRGHLLVAAAERTRLELLGRRRLEGLACGSGPPGTSGRDRDAPAGQIVNSKLCQPGRRARGRDG